MEVPSVSNPSSVRDTTGKSAATAAANSATLDYNAFLQLLIAQMQNQDPMEPMKSSDYVAQLATFSQVEKSVQINDRLAELLTSSHLMQAEGLVGETVTSADGKVTGTVTSAKIVEGGVVAILNDGREVRIGPGVIIGGDA